MGNIHVAEVGTLFENADSFSFRSTQNLLEYDFILIDVSNLIEEIRDSSIQSIQRRVADLHEFIKRKGIPIVFVVTRSCDFYILGSKYSIFNALDIEVEEEPTKGKKIETKSGSLFADFLEKYASNFEYRLGFLKHPGVSIGNAKSKTLSTGFYTKDFVFLPPFSRMSDTKGDQFLLDLYEICLNLRKSEGVFKLPDWVNNYYLPSEENERIELDRINQEINILGQKRNFQETLLSNFIPLKQLWTASGITLENSVKKVFEELGFNILPSISGRDDITMKWNDKVIVVEVKGQTKSAAEKNAAQLEKWVSTHYADYGVIPKGLLIVNTYRESPLENRTEVSFPNQMIPYSESRKHCLLTTLQLCGLLLACRTDSDSKELLIKELLATDGCYKNFNEWREFLSIKEK